MSQRGHPEPDFTRSGQGRRSKAGGGTLSSTARTAVAAPRDRALGSRTSRWASTGRAIVPTSSKVVKSRPARRAAALAAASRCTAALGLAPRATPSRVLVARVSSATARDLVTHMRGVD
jgi:hypothetical protein